MGWRIARGILVLLAILPLGVGLRYNWEGIRRWVIAGPMKITLLPKKKKPQKKKAEKKPEKEEKTEKPKESPSAPAPEKPEEKKGGSVTDFLPLVRVALDLLGDFRRKLRVNRLELEVKLAGDDPCDLAVNYGRACAAVANLMPQLERAFVIKKRHVWVGCDFEGDQTLIYGRLDLTITLGRIVWLAVRYGIRALRVFLKINKQRKGGATS